MSDKAYIGLNEDNCWTLYFGDGSEDEKYVLAVGRSFEPGLAIQEAMDELEAWAQENGYELDAPLYSKTAFDITEVIEPEVFDEVFGTGDEEDG